jgi:hypothetical protein
MTGYQGVLQGKMCLNDKWWVGYGGWVGPQDAEVYLQGGGCVRASAVGSDTLTDVPEYEVSTVLRVGDGGL